MRKRIKMLIDCNLKNNAIVAEHTFLLSINESWAHS